MEHQVTHYGNESEPTDCICDYVKTSIFVTMALLSKKRHPVDQWDYNQDNVTSQIQPTGVSCCKTENGSEEGG